MARRTEHAAWWGDNRLSEIQPAEPLTPQTNAITNQQQLKLELQKNYIFNKKTHIKNDPVASPDHALDSNQGEQALSTCRGSHLSACFGGPRVIVAMSTMIVAVKQYCGNPIIGRRETGAATRPKKIPT